MKKFAILAGAAAALALAAGTSAYAADTTFAEYQATGNGKNIEWTSAKTAGGTLSSIGTEKVEFSFFDLGATSAAVSDVSALLTFTATTSSPASKLGGLTDEPDLSGTFSIVSTKAITIGSTTYAAGSDLLSATFNNMDLFGKSGGTGASAGASVLAGSSVTFTSDFLTFQPGVDRDIELEMTSLSKAFTETGGKIPNFKGVSTGSFASDPAPLTNAVPEPATWALMIGGLGMMGAVVRRRDRRNGFAAA